MSTPYNPNFKDELVTTGLVMALIITGSFFFASGAISRNKKSPNISIENEDQVLGTTEVITQEVEKTIKNAQQATQPIPNPTPSIINTSPASSSARQTPQYSNTIIEQPYGVGGEYETEYYKLSIINPRLIVSTSRVFKVDAILANKSVESGLKNRLSSTIIKDGSIIAASAPFSLSESAVAFPGEQITFTASLSLISGTDVSRIKYLPLIDSVPDTVHDL